MESSYIWILVMLCGALDRVRGSNVDIMGVGLLDKLAYAFVIALLAGGFQDQTDFIAFIVLYGLGMSFGWGTPLGAFVGGHKTMDQTKLEWWQVGVLKTNVTLAVCARGILWGLPVLPLMYWNPSVLAPAIAIAIAFPLAALLSRLVDKGDHDQWEWMEVYRGTFNGMLTLFIATALEV